MTLTPKTEQQLAEENLFPAAVYPFEVVKAEDKTSKSGNEMIVLNLRLFYGERTLFLNDYLLEAFGVKLRHACVTLGLGDKYEAGSVVAADFLGKTGFAKVTIKKDKLKKGEPDRELYPDQNQVVDYLEEPKEKAAAPSGSGPMVPDEDDGIPFAPNYL